MKLVEILAKKLDVWPSGAAIAVQDGDTRKTVKFGGEHANPSIALLGRESVWQAEKWNFNCQSDFDHSVLASDWKTAKVTEKQWQAERDRQKGGEWKRHRGGKCPVPVGTKVSTRHRDGEVVDVHFHTATTGSGPATMNAIWKHTGDGHDIMAYKIISQPQAEGVEVGSEKKWYEPEEAPDTRGHKGPFPCAPEGEPLKQLEWDIQFPSGVCSVQAKTEQMETPFKWRDEVTELNAYIEKYTRERDALIERLASEGFALIPPVVSVVSEFSGVDMSDWRNWKSGDIVECVTGEFTGVYTKGNHYKVEWVKEDCFSVYDDCGEKSSCDWFDHEAEGLKFIRRP